MCAYCMMADWGKDKQDYWTNNPDQFRNYDDILKRIKALEDAMGGCPNADPEKEEWIKEIRDLLDKLETDR